MIVFTSAMSFALWFLIGFRTALTYLLFQSNPRLGSQVLLAIMLWLVLMVLLARIANILPAQTYIPRPIAFYLLWCAISLLWTAGPLINAMGYLLILACDLWLVSVMGRPGKAMRGYVVANLCVAAIAALAPGADDGRMGHQEYLHPNMIGAQFAIACFFCFALWQSTKKRHWLLAGSALLLALLFSLSKTAIIAFSAAAFYYLLFRSRLKFTQMLKATVAAAFLLWLSFGTLYAYAMYYFVETDAYLTLTGRTTIWATTIDIALEKPLLGHGYYSYRAVVPWFGADRFESWQAHNEFLQQWFTLGIPGVVLVTWIYCWFAKRTWKYGVGAMLLVYALLHGLVDANHAELTVPLSVLFLVASAAHHNKVKDIRSTVAGRSVESENGLSRAH